MPGPIVPRILHNCSVSYQVVNISIVIKIVHVDSNFQPFFEKYFITISINFNIFSGEKHNISLYHLIEINVNH